MSRKSGSAKAKQSDPSDAILSEYRGRIDVYKDFATTCKSLIEKLLRRKEIRVHSVTCREKTPDSLKDKLAKREQGYDRLGDVADLAGVRIITYFADEVDAIGTIIEREFDIIPEKSIDKRQALDPDRFGYLSLHYVCTMPDRRTSLSEYSPYRGLACEIQVRSILQHAWAEIEHDLGYKAAQGIPRQIRRRFSRLAGLLETGDEEFMRIRNELAEYADEVKKDIAEKPREVLLDKVSLRTFVLRDETVAQIDSEMLGRIGAQISTDIPEVVIERQIERYVEALKDVGILTIHDLKTKLIENQEVLISQFEQRYQERPNTIIFQRGISVLQLRPVILVKAGRAKDIESDYERMGMSKPKARQRSQVTIQSIKQAMANTGGKP